MNITWLPEYQKQVEETIDRLLGERYVGFIDPSEIVFREALKHAVSAGGKRLRPIFSMMVYEYLTHKKTPPEVLEIMVGIEMIHAYSLVHDDLPCMDNDELRRGKPTVWKQYGETMAVLVGDALQSYGLELIARSGDAELITEVIKSSGDFGMVRGQVRDMFLDQRTISLDELFRLHDEKTGAIIATSFSIGARLAHADQSQREMFQVFGLLLGRAFQLQDDILDFEGNAVSVGKKLGKDIELGKGIVSKIGIESAKELLFSMEQELLQILQKYSIQSEKFKDMITLVVHRAK